MPPLRGLHLFFCGGSRGSVASPLHRGLFYGATPELMSSAGVRPAGGGRFLSLGWPMNGCMGEIPRHALCHPGFAFVFLWRFPGFRGSRLRCGQLRRGRSPLHHRAILWRPSGAHKFGGHAPANMAFLRTDVLRMGYATRIPFR